MPLRLEWKKRLQTASERVKSVDFHPTETWVLAALYNGQVTVYDYITQALIKSIEASSSALRCAKFISRKNWLICGGDDHKIRVYDYLTLERIVAFEAHTDYIRSLAVHSTMPLILSASDDLTIRSWDWDNGWQRVQSFESHAHFVMMVKWSPKDPQLFASASLDRTIKIWSTSALPLSSSSLATVRAPHFTLSGHERGVNSVEYSSWGDKPYLLSASDDLTVRVWDYQTRQCLQVLTGHTKNVCHAVFHPFLPLIVSASEDGHTRVWNSSTYRHETVLDYDMGRIWAISTLKEANDVALATDEGTLVVSVGSEKPVASMQAGKILYVKSTEIYSCNVRLLDETSIVDGEKLHLATKEVGSSVVFPKSISHHPNGRLVGICGDGEYSVLTSQALRNKAYGQACELIWAPDGSFAVREESGRVRVFSDFEEVQSFQPALDVVEVYGGTLIGVRAEDFICFYEWHSARFIRRIDCTATGIYWSDSGHLLTITTVDQYFVLRYDSSVVAAAITAGAPEEEEGIEIAFDLLHEASECVESGLWVGDCFIFITKSLRLQTFVAGQVETLAFLPRKEFLLGYVPETSRIYLADREVNVTSYKLHLPFLQFQSALVRGNLEEAKHFLENVPKELYERVARFLVHRGYKTLALDYTADEDYKFDIALSSRNVTYAISVVKELEKSKKGTRSLNLKWKQLGDTAVQLGDFQTAVDAFSKCKDVKGVFLIATVMGDLDLLNQALEMAKATKQHNIEFCASFLTHDHDAIIQMLLDANRSSEASMYSRVYKPSKLHTTFTLWQQALRSVNAHYASRMIAPLHTDKEATDNNAFADLPHQIALEELFAKADQEIHTMAVEYRTFKELLEYDFLAEFKELGPNPIWDALAGIEDPASEADSPTSSGPE